MSNIYEIDDGLDLFSFKNKYGQVICEFCFNPSDMGLSERFEKTKSFFEGFDLENKDVDEIGNAIKKQIEFLLDNESANNIFEKKHPLSLTNSGDFYFENVIEMITKIIEEKTGNRYKIKMDKVKKATAKYHK